MPFLYNDSSRKEFRQQLRRHSTPTEYYFWSFVCRSQIEGIKFRRQYGVGPFIIDFYSTELRLAIELDGETHDAPETQKYDKQRTEFLVAQNIQVVRYQNSDVVGNIDWVLQDLKNVISKRRAQICLPPPPSYD